MAVCYVRILSTVLLGACLVSPTVNSDESDVREIYYETLMNFRPCEHGCTCGNWTPSNTNHGANRPVLSSEVVTLLNAGGVTPHHGERFRVECAVSLSLILQQPYSWDLECLDDLLLSVPSNTTDIVISNFRPVRMSCGHKLQDFLHFRWPGCVSERHNPIQLLTLIINSSEIHDFPADAFSANLFDSLESIHILNNEMVLSHELQARTFSRLPSLEVISVVNNTNLVVVPSMTFSYLPQVNEINFTRNAIKHIEPRAFESRIRSVIDPRNTSFTNITELGAAGSLPHLMILDLSHNSLQTLPGQDILELSTASLKYLYLEGNPWNCSCEMAWILDLNTSILAGSPGVCHHPPALRGTPLQQLIPEDFKHCYPENLFNRTNVVTRVMSAIFTVTVCTALLIIIRVYNHRKSKVSIGQIEYDTEDILGPNVFKGKLKDGRPTAVKKYPLFVAKRSSELKILLRLSESGPSHPNVVQYLLKEETNKAMYIALELCKGNLGDYLQNAKRKKDHDTLSKLASRQCLLQIVKGLCHLHDYRIQHRNLKPANILWDVNTSGNLRLLLSDFDLGHFTGEPSLHKCRYGTEGWSAPELWDRERGERTIAVDIFSLGCVLFYVLTRSGGHPFGSLEDSMELQENILNNRLSLDSLVEFLGEFEGGLAKDLICSMTQSDSSRRPTAYEVLKHPLFWRPEKIQKFYQHVSDYIYGKQDSSSLEEKLENNSDDVIYGNWLQRLDRVVIRDVGMRGFRDQKTKVCGLLKVIRNKTVHAEDLGADVQAVYDSRGGILSYYNYHFPKLLPHTYSACMQVRDQLPKPATDGDDMDTLYSFVATRTKNHSELVTTHCEHDVAPFKTTRDFNPLETPVTAKPASVDLSQCLVLKLPEEGLPGITQNYVDFVQCEDPETADIVKDCMQQQWSELVSPGTKCQVKFKGIMVAAIVQDSRYISNPMRDGNTFYATTKVCVKLPDYNSISKEYQIRDLIFQL